MTVDCTLHACHLPLMALSTQQIEGFIRDGFVKIDEAFPRALARECREVLWRDTGVDEHDPASWTKPVIRLGNYSNPPFVAAANTPALREAFDEIVGEGRWRPLMSMGTFPIRFPSSEPTNDTGWHLDASFALPTDDPNDFLSWRVNLNSKGRALLMLFLFSDVGERDAPTRIRIGSHKVMARELAPLGDDGGKIIGLQSAYAATAGCAEALATGDAGTVYLVHPLTVHAAQAHRGTRPRFMAQPALFPAEPLCLVRADNNYEPVEQAIRDALNMGPI